MRFNSLVIALLLVNYTVSIHAQPIDELSPVDQELVKEIDVTGDEKPDKIVLHLTAKNINAPFSWTLSITSLGKQIYSYSSDDAWFNNFFNDEGFVLDCKDYISCKKNYYFNILMDSLVLTGNKWYNLEGILDKNQPNTLYPLGREQLKECCNITGDQADTILKRLEIKFRTGKVIILAVPISPVQVKPPLVFVPEINRFINFYQE